MSYVMSFNLNFKKKETDRNAAFERYCNKSFKFTRGVQQQSWERTTNECEDQQKLSSMKIIEKKKDQIIKRTREKCEMTSSIPTYT